jgi:hypothetical protein
MNYPYTRKIKFFYKFFCYLLSKISWDFTVSGISKTWICETLDGIASKYIRKRLELPVSATLSNTLKRK